MTIATVQAVHKKQEMSHDTYHVTAKNEHQLNLLRHWDNNRINSLELCPKLFQQLSVSARSLTMATDQQRYLWQTSVRAWRQAGTELICVASFAGTGQAASLA